MRLFRLPSLPLATVTAIIIGVMLLLSVGMTYLGAIWYSDYLEDSIIENLPSRAAAAYRDLDNGVVPDQDSLKLLLANLPDPLLQTNHHWGEQKEVTIGIKWEKKGAVRYRPHVMRDVKNDGHWERVTVEDTAATLDEKLTKILEKLGKTGS